MDKETQVKQFEIERTSVGSFFKTHTFKIPDFQRDYDWDDENTTFIDDIVDALRVDGLREEYFIGTVISYKDDRGFHQIIDGQQRLTSLFILIAAYRLFLKKNKETVEKQSAVDDYLIKKDKDDYVLTAEEKDLDVFVLFTTDAKAEEWIRELMTTKEVPKDKVNDFTTRHQNSLKKALKLFKDAKNPAKLYKFILNNIIITHVEALDFRKSYIVFERMNDRGKELTVPDKIKYILMSKHTSDITTFRQYSDTINKKWRLVSDIFNDENLFTTFLIHYFVAFLVEDNKWPDKGEEAVTWFRKYWEEQDQEAGDLLDDMKDKAQLYNGYKEARDNISKENEALQYKRSYYSSSISQHLPMLLAASDLEPELFNTVANHVLKLCFVMQVTRTNWQTIRAQKNNSITSFVKDIRKQDMEALEKNITGLFRRICHLEGFASTICGQGFFADGKRNDLRKFTILKIEELISKESGGVFVFQDEDKSEPEPKQDGASKAPKAHRTGERITLEHIIAKNTDAKAIVKSTPKGMSEERIKEFIGRFGNYVALGSVLNTNLQDLPTREKVEDYKAQNRTDTAKLIFEKFLSTQTKKTDAEKRTIEKYHFEEIKLSYITGFDEEENPEFSEDWDDLDYDKKKGFLNENGEQILGYFLEKQIAKREHIMLLIIKDWLGMNTKGYVEKEIDGKKTKVMVSDKSLFLHPQDGFFNCTYC